MQQSIYQLSQIGRDYLSQNNLEKAREVFSEMTYLYPNEGVGFANLGQCCFELGDHHGAIENYERALLIDRKKFAILQNRLYLLYRNACMFKQADKLGQILDKSGVEEPFISLFKDESMAKNLRIAKQRAETFESNLAFLHNQLKKNKKIKVGYLSSDFRDHPMAQIMEQVIKDHDKKQFEINVISVGPNDASEWREKLATASNKFYDLENLSDSQLARTIKEINIDILVDLNGHTNGSRQFALGQKPAPIIVNFLGFSGSMGSAYHDYIIADKTVINTGEEKYFTEKILYLPNCYHPTNNNWSKVKKKITRDSVGLPSDKFVFSCFVETLRIDQKDIEVWCKILKKSSNSVLWLKHNEQAKENILNIFRNHKIDVSRIYWAGRTDTKREYFERLSLVDLALDTFIYNGHTTTIDCLWVGVPVITKTGRHFAGRVASSILKTLNMNELVTETVNQFVDSAVRIANDRKYYFAIKNNIAKNKELSLLFDTKSYTRELEKLYKNMYEARNTN